MKVKLFQINERLDKDNLLFAPYNELKKQFKYPYVQSQIYDLAYECSLPETILENVLGEIAKVKDYDIRFPGCSDVLEIRGSDTLAEGFYYYDGDGFYRTGFDDSFALKRDENKIEVLYAQPGEMIKKKKIGKDLESMQREVEGLIETYYPFEDDAMIVCNEEGKINGMVINRCIHSENDKEILDVICGPFFICSSDIDEFKSLSPELMEKYQKKFKYPEMVIKEGTQIHAIKYDPELRRQIIRETQNAKER